MRAFAVIAGLLAVTSAVTAAEDGATMPSFLEGTALYTRDLGFCPGNPNPSDGEGTLQISRAGLYGYELGCTFVAFHPENDPESGVNFSWVAVAQCGDDSGITRPDMFAMSVNESADRLMIQSQNEYAAGMAVAALRGGSDGDPFEKTSHMSGEYMLCPTY